MAFNLVKDFFKQRDMEDRILEFDDSSATVELAAKALGCSPNHIAKSLSFWVGDKAILIVTAGDAKIDNGKFKDTFHTKAKMLSVEEVEPFIGHAVGGVCPFATRPEVEIYLDVSLKRFDTVFPACGSSNSAIELTISELEKFSSYRNWVDVCKNWKEEDNS